MEDVLGWILTALLAVMGAWLVFLLAVAVYAVLVGHWPAGLK